MVNYADLWLVHSHIASLLDGARLELLELKARSTLLGACMSCLVLRSNLEAIAIEICVVCGSPPCMRSVWFSQG